MSDQIAIDVVNDIVGEAVATTRSRRISWYDKVEAAAEEALGAGGSTEHAPGAINPMRDQAWPAMQADIRYAPAQQEAAYSPRGVGQMSSGVATASRGRGSSHPMPAPPPPPQVQVEVITRYIVLAEPYPNWRDTLVTLFRNLTPTKVEGSSRWKSGYMARVVHSGPDSPYLIGARYNINANDGANIHRWTRVVESLIRGMAATMEREPALGHPLPFTSNREKADCGIQIQVAIRPLNNALGI